VGDGGAIAHTMNVTCGAGQSWHAHKVWVVRWELLSI
jgi:hypothetical protein